MYIYMFDLNIEETSLVAVLKLYLHMHLRLHLL